MSSFPKYLTSRYKNWKNNLSDEKRDTFKNLELVGQAPNCMIISCCDSRVNASMIFGVETGEFFIHRNIANLIPPYNPDSDQHGTSAAIEFAVCALKVSHIIVLGHSSCGGIKNGYHICKGNEVNEELLFVNKWLSFLKPAFDRLDQIPDEKMMISMLEKQSIITSIQNLSEFPFVQKALSSSDLSIHGLWNNISTSELEILNPKSMLFEGL